MILKHWVDTECMLKEEEVATLIRNCIPNILAQNK